MRLFAWVLCGIGLVGCSHTLVPTVGAAGQTNIAESRAVVTNGHYASIYDFMGSPDGQNPTAPLVALAGTLYGTTYSGGKYGNGSVFAISPSGAEHVLYSFRGGRDGASPSGGLVSLSGLLYGTTSSGGGFNAFGTLFKMTTSGKKSVIHRFLGGKDGARPLASLINVGGTLYGTTSDGGLGSGDGCCGTVFSVSAGKEHTVYRFQGSSGDGVQPQAPLLSVNGKLYGTTVGGGGHGHGAVFEVSTAGKERVIYSFRGYPDDGAQPVAGLTLLKGKLYGTTSVGGGSTKCGGGGCGTIFELTAAGSQRLLFSFRDRADGFFPMAGLLAVKGLLYGTTTDGGDKSCYGGGGCGVVFKITTTGAESLVHRFTGGSGDGANPEASLAELKKGLYGTTIGGGNRDDGTVFRVLP